MLNFNNGMDCFEFDCVQLSRKKQAIHQSNTSSKGATNDDDLGSIPSFKNEYIPLYDQFLHLPIQMKYCTLRERNDGVYDLCEWLELFQLAIHERLYVNPPTPSLF